MYEFLLVTTLVLDIVVNFIDRRTVGYGDYYALTLWSTVVQFLLILPLIGLVRGLPLSAFVLCAAVGVFSAYGRIPWLHALAAHRQTLSRLTPFLRLSGVITLFAAFLLLGETFTYMKFGGALMVICGSLLVTLDHPVQSVRDFLVNNRAAGLTVIYAASSASISIVYKYLLNNGLDSLESIFSIYFFLKLFQVLALVPAVIKYKALSQSYRKIAHLRLMVFGRFLQTIAGLLYLFALSGLDLSVVQSLAALGPLLVLGIELVAGRRKVEEDALPEQPHISRTLLVRVVSILVVCAGLYLLYAKGGP